MQVGVHRCFVVEPAAGEGVFAVETGAFAAVAVVAVRVVVGDVGVHIPELAVAAKIGGLEGFQQAVVGLLLAVVDDAAQGRLQGFAFLAVGVLIVGKRGFSRSVAVGVGDGDFLNAAISAGASDREGDGLGAARPSACAVRRHVRGDVIASVARAKGERNLNHRLGGRNRHGVAAIKADGLARGVIGRFSTVGSLIEGDGAAGAADFCYYLTIGETLAREVDGFFRGGRGNVRIRSGGVEAERYCAVGVLCYAFDGGIQVVAAVGVRVEQRGGRRGVSVEGIDRPIRV